MKFESFSESYACTITKARAAKRWQWFARRSSLLTQDQGCAGDCCGNSSGTNLVGEAWSSTDHDMENDCLWLCRNLSAKFLIPALQLLMEWWDKGILASGMQRAGQHDHCCSYVTGPVVKTCPLGNPTKPAFLSCCCFSWCSTALLQNVHSWAGHESWSGNHQKGFFKKINGGHLKSKICSKSWLPEYLILNSRSKQQTC